MNAIIIDDEQKAVQILSSLLQEYCPQINILDTANSLETGLHSISTHQPDLIFLDIEMPGGSGFDLLKKLPHLNFEIIFVTSHEDYAVEAIKFCAIGYILKPIREIELLAAVNQANFRINQKEENSRNKQLLQNLNNPQSQNNRIGIPTSRGLEFVETGTIIRCEGVQRCTKLILKENKSILSSYNLGEFRKLLEAYHFYSPHKSHLISLNHIVRYDKEGTIEMTDGVAVPVARRRRQDFLEKMTRL
ncbi:MAG: LytR/AlgR family response regulator transcription factor [Saprospiraceae bacterium]